MSSSDAQVHDGLLGFQAEAKVTPLCGRCPISAGVSTKDFFYGNLGVMLRDVRPFLFFLIFMTLRVQSYLYTWYLQILKILKEFPAVFRMICFCT